MQNIRTEGSLRRALIHKKIMVFIVMGISKLRRINYFDVPVKLRILVLSTLSMPSWLFTSFLSFAPDPTPDNMVFGEQLPGRIAGCRLQPAVRKRLRDMSPDITLRAVRQPAVMNTAGNRPQKAKPIKLRQYHRAAPRPGGEAMINWSVRRPKMLLWRWNRWLSRPPINWRGVIKKVRDRKIVSLRRIDGTPPWGRRLYS